MKRWVMTAAAVLVAGAGSAADWTGVESILGRKGVITDAVIRFAFPRADLKVKLGEAKTGTALAQTAWIAFQDLGTRAAVRADLVLREDEVKPALARAVAGGLSVLALHNDLLGEKPRVVSLHLGGSGEPVALAKAVADVLRTTATPLKEPAGKKPARPKVQPDWIPVETVLGRKGELFGTTIRFAIPRSETILEDGAPVPPGMGTATAIDFAVAGKKAATSGEFVLLAGEVNPVVQALTRAGIAVTAIHGHTLHETPRLFYVHFWGSDNPIKLAEGLKAALDQANLAAGR